MIVGGALTVLGPLAGLFGTLIGTVCSFRTLGSPGISDPQKLSGDISLTLFSTFAGFAVGAIGFITFIVTFIVWRCTERTTNPAVHDE